MLALACPCLVNSVMYTGNMTAALEALLSQPQKPQSVVMVSSDVEVSQFVPAYRPACLAKEGRQVSY